MLCLIKGAILSTLELYVIFTCLPLGGADKSVFVSTTVDTLLILPFVQLVNVGFSPSVVLLNALSVNILSNDPVELGCKFPCSSTYPLSIPNAA